MSPGGQERDFSLSRGFQRVSQENWDRLYSLLMVHHDTLISCREESFTLKFKVSSDRTHACRSLNLSAPEEEH